MRGLSSGRECCSVPKLFYKLCWSILARSRLPSPSVFDFSCHEPIKQAFLQDKSRLQLLARKLVLLCWDIVLLRKWQWMTADTRSIAHCLGVVLTLYWQGKPDKAKRLASAIQWVTADACGLVEPKAILQFLYLVSSPPTSGDGLITPHTRDGHIYSDYPRWVGTMIARHGFSDTVHPL